jgi:PilZ domain
MMYSLKPQGRRQSARRNCHRAAQIRPGAGTRSRDCLIVDISDHGARLQIDGFDVPEKFVLVLSGRGSVEERACEVVWRMGDEIGAKFFDGVAD